MIEAYRSLIKAGLLPEEMPNNYTFNKVREILSEIDKAEASELNAALAMASKLEVRGPLAIVIFIKHHLQGAHQVEIDRVEENEEQGASYAVLVHPEGELPINLKHLPPEVREGSRLRYEPVKGEYASY